MVHPEYGVIEYQTFDRWKGSILDMFGILIDCEEHGRYHYYIANPEVLSEGELRTWLLDTYGTAETLSSIIGLTFLFEI